MYYFVKNQKGFFSFLDSIIAISLVFLLFLVINSIIEIPDSSYSNDNKEFKESHDIMELMSSKVNFTDKSTLEEISDILNNENNSNEAITKSREIVTNYFDKIGLKSNYLFAEENVITNDYIAYSGDFKNSENVSVARKNFGNYSFVLYIY